MDKTENNQSGKLLRWIGTDVGKPQIENYQRALFRLADDREVRVGASSHTLVPNS